MVPGTDCLKDQVILKIKPVFASQCGPNFISIAEVNQILNYAKAIEVIKLYPNHQTPIKPMHALGRKLADLSLIYNVTYSGALDIRKLLTELNSLEAVEYAAPRMIKTPMLIPNDDSLSLQWYLTKIRAIEAWDLDTGDTNVVIAVVDGGTHFAHQDLADNVAWNYADPIDG